MSGETFLYLGRQYRLWLDLNAAPRPLRLDQGWLRLPIPRQLPEEHRPAFVRAALVDWYNAQARRRLPERVVAWANKLGVAPPSLLVAEAEKRWGSATSSGTIRLNWRIIQAPMSLIDYVVAHELTHLKHPNHTREFWAALGTAVPTYERSKARLRAVGPELDW